jgi:hypothetical protein
LCSLICLSSSFVLCPSDVFVGSVLLIILDSCVVLCSLICLSSSFVLCPRGQTNQTAQHNTGN